MLQNLNIMVGALGTAWSCALGLTSTPLFMIKVLGISMTQCSRTRGGDNTSARFYNKS